MYIVKLDAFEGGARPPLQSWTNEVAPDGFALCPDEFYEIFYSSSPSGFVNIEVENGVVVRMEVNQSALDAYVASLPEPVESEPAEEDDTAAILVDHEYRLTLLELGLSE